MLNVCAIIECCENANFKDFDIELLKSRASHDIGNKDIHYLCDVHYKKYFIYFKRCHNRNCFNPWRSHKKNIKKDLIDISTEDAELYKIIPGSILCKNCKSRFDRGDRLDDSNSSIEQDVTVEDSETPSIQENNDAASDVSFLEMEAEPSCMENILPCKHSK